MFFLKKIQKFIIFCNATTQFDVMVSPYKDHNFFVEHPIDFTFSGSNVMLLKYYKTIPPFSGDAQTVRNYVCLCKTSFKKVIFFGLLRVLMMSLPRQPVFSVSMVTFLSFFYQQLRLHRSSHTPIFQYNG